MNGLPVRARIEVKNAVLVRKALQDLEAEVPKIGRAEIYKSLQRARAVLAREADVPPGKYPWKTDRQRRYVLWAMSTGVLKRPYQRSHKYSRGWRLRAMKSGWQLMNETDYAGWVAGVPGVGQARLHRGRWAAFRPAVQAELRELPKRVRTSLRTLVERTRTK